MLKIKVIPNSRKTELVEEKTGGGSRLKLYLKAVPEKGRANKELIRFFRKNYGLNIKIKAGKTSKEKLLRIIDKF